MKDFVSHNLDSYGKGNSEAITECLIEVLTTVKKGNVEVLCAKDAVMAGWEKVTQEKLDFLKKNGKMTVDENGK